MKPAYGNKEWKIYKMRFDFQMIEHRNLEFSTWEKNNQISNSKAFFKMLNAKSKVSRMKHWIKINSIINCYKKFPRMISKEKVWWVNKTRNFLSFFKNPESKSAKLGKVVDNIGKNMKISWKSTICWSNSLRKKMSMFQLLNKDLKNTAENSNS